MNGYMAVGVALGGFGTLAIYSFLYRENRFYRIFEHVFIGIGVGVGVVETVRSLLLPRFFEPVWYKAVVGLAFRLRCSVYASAGPVGEFLHRIGVEAWRPREFLWLLPAAFGSLYYAIYSRRYNWLARLVIGFWIGAAGGMAFEGFFSEFMPQIFAAFRPIVVFVPGGGVDWNLSILNLVITFSTLATMSYFIFTVDRRRLRLERMASAGRLLMMVSFGAIFGSTVTARLALLIERLQFLYSEWPAAFWTLWFIVLRRPPPS